MTGGHKDAELNRPEELDTERLFDIARECLGKIGRLSDDPRLAPLGA